MDHEHDDFDEGDAAPAPRSLAPRAMVLISVVIVVAAGLAIGLAFALSGGTPSGTLSPEGVPVQDVPELAPADTTASGVPVDGISCRTSAHQTVNYHVHVLVDVFVDGRQERVPAGVGIPAPLVQHLQGGRFADNRSNGCLYLLHVHADDGVVHVESPYTHTFTLGQFFDIWQQPLGDRQVGPAHGHVVAYENGRLLSGNPRDVPLLPHAVIQLDVGSPAPAFRPVRFTVIGVCGEGAKSCAA